MEPRSANVAKAAALLDAAGIPDGDGVSSDGVTKEVRATDEELDAQAVLTRGERTTQIRNPNKSAQRERDVMGRFEADGTPKKAAKTTPVTRETAPREQRTRDTKKVAPVAEGTDEATPVEAKPDGEKTRADRMREKLAELRATRKADAAKKAAAGTDAQLRSSAAEERAAAQREREAAAQERARWEAAKKDPVAAFRELGIQPSDAFLQLADAAKKAGTPEARIEALEALAEQRDKDFREYRESVEREKQEAQDSAARARDRSGFLAVATKDAYPCSHAYLKAEAKKQGIDPGDLFMRAADHVADEQRAKGQTPSYKSIADGVEEYAQELVLEMLAELPPEFGSAVEKAAQRKPSDAPTVPAETKGKKSATTIGNELVSTRLSNNSRRLSMTERQKRAEKFFT